MKIANNQETGACTIPNISTTKIGYAHPCIWILLFLPYSSCDPKLQLLPVPTREKKCHVALDYEAIVAVPDLFVAVADTSWGSLPY